MNLYEITESFKNLQEALENSEEESLSELITQSLADVNDTFETKVENIVKYSKNLNAEASAIKEEIDRLNQRYKTLVKKSTRLEEYLFNALKYADRNSVKAGIFEVSIKKNPVSLKVIDETMIPRDYFKVKYDLDKATLKEALKNGETITGVELEAKEQLKVK